jgi:hypothetical protein
VMCCSFVPFFTFGLRVFSTVLPNFYLWSRDWVMCCSLDSFLCVFGLRVFFNSNFYLWSRDWVMCCSFVIPFFVFGLKSIFQQSTQFLPISRVSDVLLFVIPFFTFGLKSIFQQSYPISTYESRDWWCAALCDSFLYVWS